MFNNIEALKHQIRINDLDAIEDRIIALARHSVLIKRKPVNEDELPLGAPKLGGNPDLPQGFAWPHRGDKPLTFIAQFKLSEVHNPLPEAPDPSLPQQLTLWDMDTIPSAPIQHTQDILPEQGMLYFFYDTDEIIWGDYTQRDGWYVHWIADEYELLQRKQHPTFQGIWNSINALPPHDVRFIQRLVLPSGAAININDLMMLFTDLDGEPMHPSWYEENYWEMVYANYPRYPEPRHWIYGYPLPIQGEVERYCAVDSQQLKYERVLDTYVYRQIGGRIVDMKKETNKWHFLFQIDTDYNLNVMWGDGGTLYVCIPKDSLAARRFEDCWTVMQCS